MYCMPLVFAMEFIFIFDTVVDVNCLKQINLNRVYSAPAHLFLCSSNISTMPIPEALAVQLYGISVHGKLGADLHLLRRCCLRHTIILISTFFQGL